MTFRSTLLSRLGLAGMLAAYSAACEPLPAVEPCGQCETECPGDLECKNHVCVDPDNEQLCDDMGTRVTDGTSGAAGAPSDCDPPPAVCKPILTTSVVSACVNRPFSIQLEAHCECEPEQEREMYWNELADDGLPEGVELTHDGSLSGTLPAGSYPLGVRMFLAGEPAALFGYPDLTLEVEEHCLVTFLSEAESAGVPRVAVVQTDTQEFEGWVPEEPTTAVDRYDISSNGRYLAAVVDGDKTLELFALDQFGSPNIQFQYTGEYIAHAFSPDSRWLALVTTKPAETDTELLHLVKLDGEAWQPVDERPIDYVDGLNWFGRDQIVFIGEDTEFPDFYVAPNYGAANDGLSKFVPADTRFLKPALFYGLLPGPSGFVIANESFTGYFDEPTQDFHIFPALLEVVSPGLSYRSQVDEGVVVIDPINQETTAPPYASGQGCEHVRAWSQDDTTLLCSSDNEYNVFQVQGQGDLSKTRIDTESYEWLAARASLSRTGNWLAFLPNKAGLHVLPKSRFGEALPNKPYLDTVAGGWDFFFTPSEQRLVVQQGALLWVAELDTEAPSEPYLIAENMGAISQCEEYWRAGSSDRWCGGPRVRDSAELSNSERYLAFHDREAQVYLADLVNLEVANLGTLSDSCTEECIQFQ